MKEIGESVIEWLTGSDHIACTFTQRRFINKVLKLARKHPEIVTHLVKNRDGSIFCHLPLRALKLYIKPPSNGGFQAHSEDRGGTEEET